MPRFRWNKVVRHMEKGQKCVGIFLEERHMSYVENTKCGFDIFEKKWISGIGVTFKKKK